MPNLADRPPVPTFRIAALTALTLAAAVGAALVLPHALPRISLGALASREAVLDRASAFVRRHAAYDSAARTAVRFVGDDSLRTFIELAGGGKDTLDAVVARGDAAIFAWLVRFFEPENPRETVVQLSSDARVIGFRRALSDTDVRPALEVDAARAVAERVITEWTGRDLARYRFQAASYDTRSPSGRVDRTFTYERADRTVGGAPLRLDVVIAGDLPVRAREYVVIPASFSRRYDEMRAWNDFLALAAGVALVVFALIAIGALVRYGRRGLVRWPPALAVGAVVGALLAAAALNDLPTAWFDYDTATSPASFLAMHIGLAVATGLAMTLFVGMTLAAAEALTREAFPDHLDWWRLWRYRATRDVAGRVFGGYALAVLGFLYIGVFYFAARQWLGWWVPSDLLDDPNQIATPLPWLAGVAIALQAGVWEEALFRAVPLAALAVWVGDRPHRRLVMALGVAATAIAFGFAHANYPSWPPYSRGVELFLEAALWAAVYLRYGLIVTVVAHFAFNLTLFSLFAAQGEALAYRATTAIVVATLLVPAAAVVMAWARRRPLPSAPADARFAAWRPAAAHGPTLGMAIERRPLGTWARALAMALGIAGIATVAATARRPVLGPPFSVSRAEALAAADSALRAHGTSPSAWHRLVIAETYEGGRDERFLERHGLAAMARALATTYRPAAAWLVRYVRTSDPVAARAEEWRARVLPNGRLLGVVHTVPQDAPGDTLSADSARAIAGVALARAGLDTARLREVRLQQIPRARREDTIVEYIDTAVALSAGASARARVELAGAEPTAVGRFVDLPERFLREDRRAEENRSIIAFVSALCLMVTTAAAAIWILRRALPALPAASIGRRAAAAGIGAIATLQLASAASNWPHVLFSYDTATPWPTFIATQVLSGAVGAIMIALLVAALLTASGSLRRRVGIPFWPDGEPRAAARDALLSGVALAMVSVTLAAAVSLAARHALPPAPTTVMDLRAPWIARAIAVLQTSLVIPTVLSIPFLVFAVFARRWAARTAIGVSAALLVASTGPARELGVPGGFWALALGAGILLALAWGAFALWGTRSALSWYLAALLAGGAECTRLALASASSTDRVAALVGLVVAAVSVAVLYAVAVRSGAASPRAGLPEPA